jgi:hypothetical protein
VLDRVKVPFKGGFEFYNVAACQQLCVWSEHMTHPKDTCSFCVNACVVEPRDRDRCWRRDATLVVCARCSETIRTL